MSFFLLSLFPIALARHLALARDKSECLPAAVGFFSAALLCALKAFFSFQWRAAPASFAANFVYFFARGPLEVAAIPLAIYMALTNDGTDFKARSVFPLSAAFLAAHLPFCALAGGGVERSAFVLLAKPALYLAMASLLSSMAFAFSREKASAAGQKAKRAAAVAAVLAAPAAAEAMWFTALPAWSYIFVSIAFVLAALSAARRYSAAPSGAA